MNRRDFIKLMAASAMMAGTAPSLLSAHEKLIPYVVPPEEEIIPGKPLYYRSTCTECPAGCGISIKVYDKVIEGRHRLMPVKFEGLPGHPINDGKLCLRGQASLARMFLPDRIAAPQVRAGDGSFHSCSWDEALALIASNIAEAARQGRQSAYLASLTTGALAALLEQSCEQLHLERLPFHESFSQSTLRYAYELLFNEKSVPSYDIAGSDFLLTVGADVLATFLSPVSFARQISKAMAAPQWRWVHTEPHLTISGQNAHQRLAIKPGSEPYLLLFLLRGLIAAGRTRAVLPEEILTALPEVRLDEAAARTSLALGDLTRLLEMFSQAQRPLLITGETAAMQENGLATTLLSGLLQYAAGMINATIVFGAGENYEKTGDLNDINRLCRRLSRHEIGVLFISRTDLVTQAPGALNCSAALQEASFRVGLGDLMNPTLQQCDVVLPLSHALESWGDVQPRAGVTSVIQPVTPALHDTKAEGEILLGLLQKITGKTLATNYQSYLFGYWQNQYNFNGAKELVNRGYLEEIPEHRSVTLQPLSAESLTAIRQLPAPLKTPALVVAPSVRSYDGRSDSLPLAKEIPDPLSTITYGAWVGLAAATGGKLAVNDGDLLTLSFGKQTAELLCKVQPGLPEDVFLTYPGMLPDHFLGYEERTGELTLVIGDVQIHKNGERRRLPVMSGSLSQQGRGIIPKPVSKSEIARHNEKGNWYPEPLNPLYHWAMAIDLRRCNGCSACVAACYQENNVPVVGVVDHLHGRELSWLRIEPYFEQDGTYFVPMLCQQCDYAPCEPVCPVYASLHNQEGLNVQVYNRCVGTRYCANNCPYKVRRFNWFDYARPAPLAWTLNPEMLVRSRGIMEKCTFCIQRIRAAKDAAKDQKRQVRDGEVIPACVQTCPTGALTFGNLKDGSSQIFALAHSDRAYRVFEQLGTSPSVFYLHKNQG